MRTRPGLKALGLSALVMGVMAIGNAGAAQGETGACWGYINAKAELKCFAETELSPQPLFTFENKTRTFLITNVNLEVLCTGVKLIEGGKLGGGSIALGRLEFVGCISLSKTPTLTKLNSCTPKDPVGGLGTIRTEKFTGLILLHNTEPVIELKPDVGTVLAKIFYGEECAVAEELIITGKLILQEVGGKKSFEEHKLVHLLQEFPGLELVRVGVNKATTDGTAEVTLESPHSLLKWAGKAA